MKYRYQVRALDSRWLVVDTKTGVAIKRKPFKTMRGAVNRAIKENEQCLTMKPQK